jgi:peptidoglycan/LPS O-acetylase OafA/YrhL
VRPAQVAVLVATLVAAQVALFFWKQLAGAYTIQHRAVEFARGLTLVYVAFVLPRIGLTWLLGAAGFCVGLVAYQAAQVMVLGRRA